ncbi:MAG TPA: GNAT family N-acetyltransferase [Azospirillum sp.]
MDGRHDDGVIARETIGMPVTIRRCRADDLAALEWYGLYTPHREIIQATFKAQEGGDAVMLVTDVGGFPAGQAWLDFARKREQGFATLWALRIFPPFQRAGLGHALMRAAERVALERGVAAMELGVDRDNPGVLRFYERLGYVPAGSERGEYSYRTPDGALIEVPIDQWLLRKSLAAAPRRRALR